MIRGQELVVDGGQVDAQSGPVFCGSASSLLSNKNLTHKIKLY